MKKTLLTLLVLGALGGGGYAYYAYRTSAPQPTVMTAEVTYGDIADTVGATGTLQAVTTVQVGTQVSGIVQELYADFNTLVKKGQVIARLDPSTIETQIEQARANLIRAQADLERLHVAVEDARNKLKRAQELAARNLIPATELEAAQVSARSAEAQVRSAEASIIQSQASLRQNEVNLEHTVISAPIDGLVISRNVDRGQTVAASMQAPTLFVLAADLTKMQVVANLDESDVGRIRPGQRVFFRVDAYPTEQFRGRVTQVRLQPIVQQNVVTYATVIDVPNPELKLKPGMTANVNIEIAERTNVIRVPNAALRFRPTNEMFAALGQTPPSQAQRAERAGAGGRGTRQTATQPAPSTSGQAPVSSTERGRSASADRSGPGSPDRGASSEDQGREAFGNEGSRRGRGDFGGDRAQIEDRLQGLSPVEREQMLERMRARGFDRSSAGDLPPDVGARGGRGVAGTRGGGRRSEEPGPESLTARNPNATTIDALFGPLPAQETTGRVWLHVDKQLRAIQLRLGISDGQTTELLEGDLQPGMQVVTNVATGETRPALPGFPFLGPGRGGFGPPGGFGGFGGDRGGGGNRGTGGPGGGGGRGGGL